MESIVWKTAWMVVGYAPTIYQSHSLFTLMGEARKNGNGSFYACREFETEEQAKEWLSARLWWLYQNGHLEEEEFNEQNEHLVNGGSAISYDAAYCNIQSVYFSEDREEEEDEEA